ncbi:hypothetical protein K470DRAFT_45690 [Piedraia hortae CBS 480.64]|uniref:Uncharacterized protein n=1 Tax=Piedraia hortae CBS 480.64 TaxID=1314780 RepID=A0A6A7C1C2_9PEZI|nr:hypothetical protein K470DRAFT_45690 [Piedraia hortae CBS 480.64]
MSQFLISLHSRCVALCCVVSTIWTPTDHTTLTILSSWHSSLTMHGQCTGCPAFRETNQTCLPAEGLAPLRLQTLAVQINGRIGKRHFSDAPRFAERAARKLQLLGLKPTCLRSEVSHPNPRGEFGAPPTTLDPPRASDDFSNKSSRLTVSKPTGNVYL